MELHNTVQDMSDEFHALTTEVEDVLTRLMAQTQRALEVRKDAGLSGAESQRTIGHLTKAIEQASEIRGSITAAHRQAQKDATRADLPWECPPDASHARQEEAKVIQLRVAGQL